MHNETFITHYLFLFSFFAYLQKSPTYACMRLIFNLYNCAVFIKDNMIKFLMKKLFQFPNKTFRVFEFWLLTHKLHEFNLNTVCYINSYRFTQDTMQHVFEMLLKINIYLKGGGGLWDCRYNELSPKKTGFNLYGSWCCAYITYSVKTWFFKNLSAVDRPIVFVLCTSFLGKKGNLLRPFV